MDLYNVPIVSIACITYNQENYIKDTIDGFLMQKTTFPIEIIINDDASTDNTTKFLRDYADKHPNLIIPIFQKENQYSKGINPGVKFVLPLCKGKYIALCEGDDYWIDPYKLQKQVDFLEANKDFVISHHNMKVIYENSNREPHLSNSPEQKEITTIEDLASSYFIYTASSIFRNGLIKEFPDWFYQSPLGDYMLYMLIAQYGKIKYFPDVMGVYRVHENGIWSNLSDNCRLEKQLNTLKVFIIHFKSNESVYDCLKIRYIEICLHLINTYKLNDENKLIEILHLLNEVEPGYFYNKYMDISESLENLSGSRKNLVKALIGKQLYHTKRYFSQK